MICPRCDKANPVKIFEAPSDGSWELFRCVHCNFTWRSTEQDRLINSESYRLNFKLNEQKMETMIEKPPIPPLRSK